jgi:hypothetical protein
MMRRRPQERPSASECLNHPFFRETLSLAWIRKEMELTQLRPITAV